jgi:hypothetical protein
MIITIRKIALSPQPHIVQLLETTERSDPLRTLVFILGLGMAIIKAFSFRLMRRS